MKERIIEFLKSENKSSAQLADEINVQPSGISHILSGRNNPSLDFVLKMLQKFPYLSSDWLLFGKGTMYKEAQMQNLFDETVNLESGSASEDIKMEIIRDNKHDKSESADVSEPDDEPDIEKIVWFYKDNSFRQFFPGEKNR